MSAEDKANGGKAGPLPFYAVGFAIAVCLLGLALGAVLIWQGGLDIEAPHVVAEVSALLFIAQDIVAAGLSLVVFAVVASRFSSRHPFDLPAARAGWLAALIGLTFVLGLVSRYVVNHAFDMSIDEFMPRFQAEIFLSGELMAPLNDAQFAVNKLYQPFFTYVDETHQLWASHYRPVHAALLSAFVALGAADIFNPVMAAVSVWAIADVSRRLFPEHREAPLLAALLLIASPQFLITAGTGFAFSAHLALNLLWLSFFLRNSMLAHTAAALIGFAAIGLHQVHVHPLFAAPFLFAVLTGHIATRAALVPYIFSYGLALPLWIVWPEIAAFLQTGDAGVLPRSLLEIDYVQGYLAVALLPNVLVDGMESQLAIINILRYLLWLSPALLPLIAVAVVLRTRIPLVQALAGIGALLTIAASQMLMATQMQSWGSRYFHPVMGNVVIFAMSGLYALDRGRYLAARKATVALVVTSLLIFLPLRAVQVEAKVGPRARVQAAIERIDAEIVAINSREVWFGADFIRNDPYLRNRPLIRLLDGNDALLPGGGVQVVGLAEMRAMGLPFRTLYEPGKY